MIALSKRFPFRWRKPARAFSGASWALITSRSVANRPSLFSYSVLPLTVTAVCSILPIAISSATTAGTPPAR